MAAMIASQHLFGLRMPIVVMTTSSSSPRVGDPIRLPSKKSEPRIPARGTIGEAIDVNRECARAGRTVSRAILSWAAPRRSHVPPPRFANPARGREGRLAISEPHRSLVDIFTKPLERDPSVEKIIQVKIMEYPEARHGIKIGKHPSMKKIVVPDIQYDGVALRIEPTRGKFVPPRHLASGRQGRSTIARVALAPHDRHRMTTSLRISVAVALTEQWQSDC